MHDDGKTCEHGPQNLESCIMHRESCIPKEESMSTSTFKIQGMTCNHCVMRVAKALKAVPGVQDAQVDLKKAEAVVTYDEASVTREKLKVAVVDAGYKIV